MGTRGGPPTGAEVGEVWMALVGGVPKPGWAGF